MLPQKKGSNMALHNSVSIWVIIGGICSIILVYLKLREGKNTNSNTKINHELPKDRKPNKNKKN